MMRVMVRVTINARMQSIIACSGILFYVFLLGEKRLLRLLREYEFTFIYYRSGFLTARG